LGEAKAALATTTPNRVAARAALERAIAADDDAATLAEAYFRLGALDEEDGAFEIALERQRACIARGPSNFARSARLRIGWIEARSEGDFAPLARLQRVRRDPTLLNDAVAIESLATDAEAFPPGRVRAEARMFVAGAWMNRMNRREDAIAELHKVGDDPSSDSMDSTIAHRHLLEALLADGRLEEAESEARSHPIDPQLGLEVRRLVRRRLLRWAARVELVAFIGVAIVGLARARSQRGRNYVQKANTALHGLLPMALAASLALLCWMSVVSAAFVWLDVTHARYLESVGL
jgi:tetratricopeptide (TPR) repeat protein